MLTRSGFSIRRLISQNKLREDKEDLFEYDEKAHAGEGQRKTPQSWMSSRPANSRRKGPPEPITIRDPQNFHSIHAVNVPRLPDTPPRSLSPPPSGWDSRVDGPHTTTGHSRPSSKSLSPYSCGSPRPSRQQTVSRRKTCGTGQTPRQAHHDTSPRPSLDLPEQRTHSMDLKERSRRVTVDPSKLEGWSEDVQQLIREADQAFKSTSLLSPAHRSFVPRSSLDKDLPPLPLNTPDKSRPSSTNATPRKARPILITTPPTPMQSPVSITTISKVKRKKATKKDHRQRKPKQYQARWTLGENVAELFSGFKKIEADEMITPEDVEEFRRNRLGQTTHKKSNESLRSEASEEGNDTPIEPFHLDDLPLRIGAAGVKTAVSPIDSPTHGHRSFGSVVRKDFTAPKQEILQAEDVVVSPITPEDDNDDQPIQNDAMAPTPPAKNPARFSKQSPHLPTIPEVLVTCPKNCHHRPTSRIPFPSSDPFASAEDDDFVYLKSTPCTLTQPGFVHGAIRFSKADLNMRMASDNTLDWTAFQMAILGGVGDFFHCSDWHYEQSENDEAERLTEWFEDFGFETAGELITNEEIPFDASPSTCEYSPVSATSTEDLDLPIPVVSEHPNGFWNEGKFDASRFATTTSCGIKRWTVEGHPKPYTGRSSLESNVSLPSLPPSPMMPLVLTKDANDQIEVVPMGYNLHHDLGDFLKWEAAHVYAGEDGENSLYE